MTGFRAAAAQAGLVQRFSLGVAMMLILLYLACKSGPAPPAPALVALLNSGVYRFPLR